MNKFCNQNYRIRQLGRFKSIFTTFSKLLGTHHHNPNFSFDFFLQTGSQCLNFIHVHITDYQHIDQAAVAPFGIVIEGIDRFNFTKIIKYLFDNFIDTIILLYDRIDFREKRMVCIGLVEYGLSPLLFA